MVRQIETGSKYGKQIVEVLKGADAHMTIKEIAEAIGCNSSAVTGFMTSLVKKEVAEKIEAEDGAKRYKLLEDIELVEKASNAKSEGLTEKGAALLEKFKAFHAQEGDFMAHLADDFLDEAMFTSKIGIVGTLRPLVKRELVIKGEVEVPTAEGGVVKKAVYQLTPEGLAYKG